MKRSISILSIAIFASCSSPDTGIQEEMEEGVELTSEMSLVGEEVSYSAGETEMNGYMAFNETDTSKRPGILVVHEWWGHNDYVRERADMLAELGFVALAVDMYGEGKQADHPSDAKKFSGMVMQNMDVAEMRFTEAMKLLRNHPLTDSDKISAVGYCFGGSLILAMANQGMDLDAVAAFHSSVELPVSPSEELQAKVLVQNGSEDPFVSELSVSRFETEMDSLGKPLEYVAYPDARHAYTNPGADSLGQKFDLPLAYNREVDIESWDRMKSFFQEVYPKMDLE